jgi:hypothetical protein
MRWRARNCGSKSRIDTTLTGTGTSNRPRCTRIGETPRRAPPPSFNVQSAEARSRSFARLIESAAAAMAARKPVRNWLNGTDSPRTSISMSCDGESHARRRKGVFKIGADPLGDVVIDAGSPPATLSVGVPTSMAVDRAVALKRRSARDVLAMRRIVGTSGVATDRNSIRSLTGTSPSRSDARTSSRKNHGLSATNASRTTCRTTDTAHATVTDRFAGAGASPLRFLLALE